jgi:hypothetical protein
LEHGESWEDQKFGVNFLLKLLRRTAVQDEGPREYEMAKRLGFSKCMTTLS